MFGVTGLVLITCFSFVGTSGKFFFVRKKDVQVGVTISLKKNILTSSSDNLNSPSKELICINIINIINVLGIVPFEATPLKG